MLHPSKGLKPWLHGSPMPIAGVVISVTGERLTIRDAVEKSLIKDGLGVALLEAQAANGFIIDAVSENGDTMSGSGSRTDYICIARTHIRVQVFNKTNTLRSAAHFSNGFNLIGIHIGVQFDRKWPKMVRIDPEKINETHIELKNGQKRLKVRLNAHRSATPVKVVQTNSNVYPKHIRLG